MSKSSQLITINTPIAITNKIFEEAADEITTATNMLLIASSCLRISYLIGGKHNELSNIRTSVYTYAKLYDDKIVPFTRTAVGEIKTFCESPGINKHSDFEKFLTKISYLKNAASENVILCEIILAFHKAILIEFKRVQDDATKLTLGLELDEKFKERRKRISFSKFDWASGLALIPEARELKNLPQALIEEIKAEQIVPLEDNSEIAAVIGIMSPLTMSIKNYTSSLDKVSGFFNKLSENLETLETKIKKNIFNNEEGEFVFDIIQGKAGDIWNACDTYIGKLMSWSTNINCINEVYDNDKANEWVRKTIEAAKIQTKFDKFLEDRGSLRRKMLG